MVEYGGLTSEQRARKAIDDKLIEAGWVLQNNKELNPRAGLGVAVREYNTNSGPVDYALFVNGNLCGIVEAKADYKAQNITVVEEQTKGYISGGSKFGNIENARFIYEATGEITRFTDYCNKDYASREVFTFHQPAELQRILQKESTLRDNLKVEFPPIADTMKSPRKCQVVAIENLEKSFAENHARALIQMATGSGKTYTAISAVYRLLKFAKAKRILFLVDTRNLGKQAMQEFSAYRPADDPRSFPELYAVHHLNSSSMPDNASVCISTIQRMYSMLRGEELDESTEEEIDENKFKESKTKEVVYNEKYPPEYFDFIIIDECHRSIYNVWQQVLDYFDAFQIGLTATPDSRTFAYFNQNIVSEYTHEQAVIDGVNVGGEIYRIKTEITENGASILEPQIKLRERKTRVERWSEADEEITYGQNELDKSVVNKNQIRTILQEYKNKMASLFPGRYPHKDENCPKTLIFAKDDSHADDIIQIARDVFGKGNDFCKKITYKAENAENTLSEFRNEFNPRIAVTVNMIATGTDVKPLECLIFMRDVKSKNYYEQMMGRGTRTFDFESLRQVSPSAIHNKDSFVLIDAVGVTESAKLNSRPLNIKPSVSLKDLMTSVITGDTSEETLTTLASRFIRLDKILMDDEKAEIKVFSDGVSLSQTSANLLNAFDQDFLESNNLKQDEYIKFVTSPVFIPEFRDYIENARKNHEQIVDTYNPDKVIFSDWQSNSIEKSAELVESFELFLAENKNRLDALKIIYNQSYKTRPLLLENVQELHNELVKLNLNETAVWGAYYATKKVKNKPTDVKLADLIELVKFGYGHIDEINSFANEVGVKYRDWLFSGKSALDMNNSEIKDWLEKIRDFIAVNVHFSNEDLEQGEFATLGGLGAFYQTFGNNYKDFLTEINYRLVS
jgi:type I restriction enzyme R subunit